METEVAMTNEINPMNAVNAQTHPVGLGVRLRSARESIRLSEKDAAARLHLSPKMIPIMENEDFQNGPPATFIRGYLRSYARLLNIPEAEIQIAVAKLEATIPKTPQPSAPPILKTRPRNQAHHYLRLMTYGVVAVLLVLVSVWWTSHPKDFVTPAKAILSNNTATPAVPAAVSTAAPTPDLTVAPVVPALAPTTPAAPTATNNVPAAPSAVEKEAPKTASAAPKEDSTEQDPVDVANSATSAATPATDAPANTEKPSTNLADIGMTHPEPGLEQTESSDSASGDDNNNNVY